MAMVLASHRCYHCNVDLMDKRHLENLGFSRLFSKQRFLKSRYAHKSKEELRFQVEAAQTEVNRLGTNGRPAKMISTKELMENRKTSSTKREFVNGSKTVNGANLVKNKSTSALVRTQKAVDSKELSFMDEMKVLPSVEGFSWAKEDYSNWKRSIDVWSFVIAFRLRILFDNAKWAYIGGFTEDKQKMRRRKTASWLKECVLQLGPTFIKLGQLSSTRSDLFPKEFVEELAKLQDRVPAFSAKSAKEFIMNELGAPVDILFKEFEEQPIAAASLGQVHRAILHNGEKVVVKVQRPGLKKLFDIDLGKWFLSYPCEH